MRKAREDKEMRDEEIARSLYYLGSTNPQSAKVKRNQDGGIICKPFNLESMKLHNRYEELVKEKEEQEEKERLEEEQKWKEKRNRLYKQIKNKEKNGKYSSNGRKGNKQMILCVEIKISPCRSAMFELYEGDDVELAINLFMRQNEVDNIYKYKLLKTIQNQLKIIEDESEIQSLPPPPPPPPPPLEEEEDQIEVQEIEDS